MHVESESIRILYVEDDEDTREVVTELLQEEGLKVFPTGDKSSALELANQAREMQITCALLDANLEKGKTDCRDGREIAAVLREQDPGIPIFVHSGLANNAPEKLDFGDVVLDKCDLDSLLSLPNQIYDIKNSSGDA